ncbi:hypothetical protein [Halpernia frigidisoli]|uniref:Uncharacterized protein n=1 Tax=Halpernia frigidisoli TaxID=1125876 RepID=A0A1I3IQ90_9FLAO|nr:hypothetical protein [Halpernia frigidisoli]SFI50138.1 hypothetical protein SAMN05443292_2734 [Halpernia frigidisoli]
MITGTQNPVVGKEEIYQYSDGIDLFNSSNATYVWNIWKKKRDGVWINITKKPPKMGQKVSFKFGEKVLGEEFKLEVFKASPKMFSQEFEAKSVGEILVIPASSKIPKITKVELLYVDDTKGKTFSFMEKLRAKANCVGMFHQDVIFTLWEDDAKGSGHDSKNLFIDSKPGKVNSQGFAIAEFTLTKALMQKAMLGEADAKQLEFYVTVEYFKNNKHATNNVDVKNPFPQTQKPAAAKPSNPVKAKGSPAESKPASKKEEKGIMDTISDKWNELWDWGESKGTATKEKPPTVQKPIGKSTAMVKAVKKDDKKEDGTCPRCKIPVTAEQLKTIFPDADISILKETAEAYSKYMKDLNMNTCWNKAHFFAQAKIEAGTNLKLKTGEGFNYAVEALPAVPFKAFQAKDKNGHIIPNDLAFNYGRIDKNNLQLLQSKYNKSNLIFQAANSKLIANTAYSNRKDLGNNGGDDGWNYRGRGMVQLTGRVNYTNINTYSIKYLNIDILKEFEKVGTNMELAVLTSMGYLHRGGMPAKANGQSDENVISAIVGNDVFNKKGESLNHVPKQKAFNEITSKVFRVNDCIYGKKDETKKGDKNQYDIYVDTFEVKKITSKPDSDDYEYNVYMKGTKIKTYTLTKNRHNLLPFPETGTNWGRFGTRDKGGDNWINEKICAALLGFFYSLPNYNGYSKTLYFNDISASDGRNIGHAGHDLAGKDVDIRYPGSTSGGQTFWRDAMKAYKSEADIVIELENIISIGVKWKFTKNYAYKKGIKNTTGKATSVHQDHFHLGYR